MDTTSQNKMNRPLLQRRAFTLVELLVVITIIGILVALVTVAAAGAMKKAKQTRIKIELDQISMAFEDFKQTYGSYPPNSVTDGSGPLDENQVLTDLKRQLKKAFPRHRESDNLLRVIVGLSATGSDSSNYPTVLAGGMSADEVIVFWLGGFSNDPKYPISGEGGPSYIVGTNPLADPIENRNWIFPFEIARLGPRNNSNFFDDSDSRFIVFNDPKNPRVQRRINFWKYYPNGSTQPFLYFDTSRGAPLASTDPKFVTNQNTDVHAIKIRPDLNAAPRFANEDKFQILHCGIDDEWGEFDAMSLYEGLTPDDLIYFPDGPFRLELADTLTNFTEGTLEDAQP